MEENKIGTQEKTGQYVYVEFPKNVRQIGVPLPGMRVYLEDYVITYLKQTFVGMEENRFAVLLGKRGSRLAEKGLFLYGAIALEEEDILENGKIEKATWDRVYEIAHREFEGAQVLGLACGVSLWNSDMENKVRKLQKEELAQENQVMFVWDLCEKEEKVFTWQRDMIKELSGYYIYFEKNPQMQDFMLDKQVQKGKSTDGDYQDKVTFSMRQVMEEKEEARQRKWQILSYFGAVAAGIAILFGVNMMMDSTARLKSMEQTVDALSEYVGRQQEVEKMARQEEVKEIPFQSQAAEDTRETSTQSSADPENSSDQTTGTKTDNQAENTGSTQVENTGMPGQNVKDTQSNSTEGGNTGGNGEEQDLSEAMAQQMLRKNAQSYIVKKGDTLSQIVWRQYHDISYEKTVRELNQIVDPDKIYEGQLILLPKIQK